LNSERPGRDGLLRLAFARRGDATILRRCRYTLPLQVLSPLTLDDGTSYLLLLNPTGGVLGGDRLHTEITLEEGARVCLSTPSATRIYRSSGAPAEVATVLCAGPNATLEYLPDHTIPHPGASLRQALRVEMDAGSRGIFFEGFSCGRLALNERWRFRDYDARTEIVLRDRLLFSNRTGICPSESGPAALGRMGNYAYSGSLLLIADQFENWPPLLAAVRADLDAIPEIFGGASLMSHSGCSIRYLAVSAIEFQAATERLWSLARRHLLGQPPLSLRKY
jgi:urease accessory protein